MARRRKNSSNKVRLYLLITILLVLILLLAILFRVLTMTKNGLFSSESNVLRKQSEKEITASPKPDQPFAPEETSTQENTSDTHSAKEASTEEEKVTNIVCDQKVLLMRSGNSVRIHAEISPANSHIKADWSSNQSGVASVDSLGTITAGKDGNAIITCSAGDVSTQIYVNVVTETPGGEIDDISLYQEDGKLIHYNLFHQSAHAYGSHSDYMAWHGCATCSTTTIVGAYSAGYPDIMPAEFIDTVEKKVLGSKEWTRQHVTKPMKTQMPISLSGISKIFHSVGIKHEYIRSFKQAKAKQDIFNHLHTGNPVLFEVRKLSNITGKRDSKWTGSVHTMIFLGVYTTGEVLVCDSVNHDWYSGGQRAKIAEIEDLMEYMYSCTDFNTAPYYKSISSDGGYIKIYNQ